VTTALMCLLNTLTHSLTLAVALSTGWSRSSMYVGIPARMAQLYPVATIPV